MRVYLDLGKIIGGVALVNEENIKTLIRRWYYSHERLWKDDKGGIIFIKIVDIIHSLLLVSPNVNGGKYFAIISDAEVMVFYSRNGINEVFINRFMDCRDDLNENNKLPIFWVNVFCAKKISSAFTGFGIFNIGLEDCDPNSLDLKILDSAREFWEKVSRSASKESAVVHAPVDNAAVDGSFCQ